MRDNKREKIIIATIECIEKYGMSGVTVRKITEHAGVNVAAVNYYFGDQAKLMEIAMATTLSNGFDITNFTQYNDKDLKEYLTAVFEFLVEGAKKYHNISKAHLYKVYLENDYNSPVTNVMNSFLEEILKNVISKTKMSERALRQRLLWLMGQIIYQIAAPNLFESFGKANIKELIECLF